MVDGEELKRLRPALDGSLLPWPCHPRTARKKPRLREFRFAIHVDHRDLQGRPRPPELEKEPADGGGDEQTGRSKSCTSRIVVMVHFRAVNVNRVVPALWVVAARKGGLPDV